MSVQWGKACVAAESEAPTSCLLLKSTQTPIASAAALMGVAFHNPETNSAHNLAYKKRLFYPRPGSAHLCSCHVLLGC